MPSLEHIGGDFGLARYTNYDAPSLTTIGGGMWGYGLYAHAFPVLETVGGDLVSYEDDDISLPALTSVGGSVHLRNEGQIDLPGLATIGGDFTVDHANFFDTGADYDLFPALDTVGGELTLRIHTSLYRSGTVLKSLTSCDHIYIDIFSSIQGRDYAGWENNMTLLSSLPTTNDLRLSLIDDNDSYDRYTRMNVDGFDALTTIEGFFRLQTETGVSVEMPALKTIAGNLDFQVERSYDENRQPIEQFSGLNALENILGNLYLRRTDNIDITTNAFLSLKSIEGDIHYSNSFDPYSLDDLLTRLDFFTGRVIKN